MVNRIVQVFFVVFDVAIMSLALNFYSMKLVCSLAVANGVLAVTLVIFRKVVIEERLDLRIYRNLMVISIVLSFFTLFIGDYSYSMPSIIVITAIVGAIRLLFMRAIYYLYKFPF